MEKFIKVRLLSYKTWPAAAVLAVPEKEAAALIESGFAEPINEEDSPPPAK